MSDTSSLKDSYFESFETFLQDLAPLTLLSHDVDKSEDHFLSINMLPEGACNETSPKMLSGGRGDLGNDSKDEVKRLQDLVELLQVRLDALQRALEIQEQEVCREMEAQGDENSCSKYEKLLTRWRREACVMLLKQRVDAYQLEQRQLQHTKKEHHLTVQLHEARALVEVLKQKEKNSQAEIAMLTTTTKVAEMTMRAEGARHQHEKEERLKGASKATKEAVTQIMEAQFDKMSVQMGRITNALCRLDMHGRRLFFAEQQVAMAVGLISSNLRSQGISCQRRGVVEVPHMPKRKESVTEDEQKIVDQVGRSNQLEVLLAATKTQLVEECLHARELQERLVKSEVEARDSIKRATKKVQDQADRDLAAIKRQHGQAMLSLQQKTVKFQTDQARGVVAQHQMERKMHQLQQEFTHTLNQKDIEFKKTMDAKEVEVRHLLDEQNALVVKLKKFWRPILNSPSAKIFQEKNTKNVLQTQQSSTELKPENSKCLQEINECFSKTSVKTQTEDFFAGEKCHCTASFHDCRDEESDSSKNPEAFPKFTEKDTSYSRLSTPSRKVRHRSRPTSKKSDDDLIASFLAKLQKAYVKSRDVSTDPIPTAISLDPSVPELRPTVAHNEDATPTEDRHTPRSSVDSKESFEINDATSENVPRYVICIPRREQCNPVGNTFFLKTKRKKKVIASTHFLRTKLEDLEDLSKSLLRGHLCDEHPRTM